MHTVVSHAVSEQRGQCQEGTEENETDVGVREGRVPSPDQKEAVLHCRKSENLTHVVPR